MKSSGCSDGRLGYQKRGNHVTERPKRWKDFLQKESAMDKEKKWGRTF